MTDTSKRTNEEIAEAIITEPNDHMGVQRIIEALNTKDREREEAVAEAVRNAVNLVANRAEMLGVYPNYRHILLDGFITTPQEAITNSSEGHEKRD